MGHLRLWEIRKSSRGLVMGDRFTRKVAFRVSGVMSQNFFFGGGGGAKPNPHHHRILRRSKATERGEGEGVGGGVPPPTVGSFCIFGLETVQSGAYLDRKF